MGFPIIECRADGTATVTKPEGTGGLVSCGSVSEQILYEIGDPGAYIMPDVVCDWRNVKLEQEGPDRVSVSGARGSAPPSTYKMTATYADGFRVMATAMFAGVDAAGKARRTGHALIARVERLLKEAGHAVDQHRAGRDLLGSPGRSRTSGAPPIRPRGRASPTNQVAAGCGASRRARRRDRRP